jgi:hypothetical protein
MRPIESILGSDLSTMSDDQVDLLIELFEQEIDEAEAALEASPSARVRHPNILIEGPPRYQEKVAKALAQIARTRTGQKLLSSLERTHKRITIRPSLDGRNRARPVDRGRALRDFDGARGPGSSAIIDFDPDATVYGGGRKAWMRRPAYVGLFHELVHAWDYTHGALAPGTTGGTKNSELSAVGLCFDHDGDASTPRVRRSDGLTENDLRAEVGLPRRMGYGHSRSARTSSELWRMLDDDLWFDD